MLAASYIFYATWDIRFLFLIILSTAVNYCCGIMMTKGHLTGRQRSSITAWVVLSCLFFILIRWNFSAIADAGRLDHVNWSGLISVSDGWGIFALVISLTALSNIAYPKLLNLDEQRRYTLLLWIGVAANLLILGIFKYFNFFLENTEWLLASMGMDPARYYLHLILPVGISFYTFKGIGYVVDVYRKSINAEQNYNDFALFISFFPALLAGPIDRAGSLLLQISCPRRITMEKTFRGIHLILYGLFKKVVIADGVVRTVNSVFGSPGQSSWMDVVIATFLFTIQIYCDFSGYTDIARGTAKLFGIDLMVNFRLPYFANSPKEFWSRWHISLSTWLRDYLYIPLGGNKNGRYQTYKNLMITMVLGGLWHGAAWNFVLWGAYHGVVMCAYRSFEFIKAAAQKSLVHQTTMVCVCFVLISYGWLLFRAPSIEKIFSLTSTLIFDFGNFTLSALKPRASALFGLPVLLAIEFVENAKGNQCFYKSIPIPAWTAIYAAMIFCLVIGMGTESTKFIYFNF